MVGSLEKKHSALFQLRLRWIVKRALSSPRHGADFLKRFSDGISGDMPDLKFGREVILAACDSNYFSLFAVDLIKSMELIGVSQSLHIHLLEPSVEVLEKAWDIKSGLKWLNLTFSIDPCELSFGLVHRQVYYTAARFMLAPMLLKAGVEKLLIIDVDALMNKSPWDLLPTPSSGGSGGFIFRPQKKRSWYRILASAVFYSQDESSVRLASVIARSLAAALLLKPSYHVDQIVPYYACCFAPGYDKAFRVFNIPPSIMAYNYEADAAFWTVKGKAEISRFLLERSALLASA
jgi:hypothetical protein